MLEWKWFFAGLAVGVVVAVLRGNAKPMGPSGSGPSSQAAY